MTMRIRPRMIFSFVCLVLLALPGRVAAVGSGPAPTPAAPRSAEAEYNNGLQAKTAKRYSDAVECFRRAVGIRPSFAEAWSELGFALRQTGQYAESLEAYDRAVQLRPNFPEALEYLGEAYVKLGRLEEARSVLERLKPLDAARAGELDEAIRAGR